MELEYREVGRTEAEWKACEELERTQLVVARVAGEIIASSDVVVGSRIVAGRCRSDEGMVVVEMDKELWDELVAANDEWAKASNAFLKAQQEKK